MALSCSIMLVVWTTSLSFQKNELNARRLKLYELHWSLLNRIAHFNVTLLFAVGRVAFLPLLVYCLWFTGLFWWALMPWIAQVLVKCFWHQYCDSDTWWLQNQSLAHSVRWMKIQSLHGRHMVGIHCWEVKHLACHWKL